MGYSTKKEVLKYNCKNIRGQLYLGAHTKIDHTCIIDLSGDVTLKDWVHLGGNTKLYTHFHPITRDRPMLQTLDPLIITDKLILCDVWILDSMILPKCSFIAQGVLIGAGSVVTKPIDEPYTIWAGNPARKIGERGQKNL